LLVLLISSLVSVAQNNNSKMTLDYFELSCALSLKENYTPILPLSENIYTQYGKFSAIDVTEFMQYTTLAPKLNYEINATGYKQFKHASINIRLGLTQIAYNVILNTYNGPYRFSDQIDPDKGFVNPSNIRVKEVEIFQQIAVTSLGYSYIIKRKKWSAELGSSIGYSYLLNMRNRIFTNDGKFMEVDLDTEKFKKGTFNLGTSQKLAWMLNKKLDFVIGMEQQWYFRLSDNRDNFQKKNYVNDGISRLMSGLGIRYHL
jgi:hypothetical protein